MIKNDELLPAGTFGKPHGVNGEITVRTDFDVTVFTSCRCIVADIDGINVPFFVTNARRKSAETLLLTIDGVDSEKKAAAFTNKEVMMLKTDFEGDCVDEVPISCLIGFTVVDDATGAKLGNISGINDDTANVLLQIEHDGGISLVPAADDFITDIDIDNKTITMDFPKELLE